MPGLQTILLLMLNERGRCAPKRLPRSALAISSLNIRTPRTISLSG